MKKVLTPVITLSIMLLSSAVTAGNNVPLNYNILHDVPNGYVIDSVHTNQISFSLFENEDAIYCNGQALEIVDNKFSISINDLSGKNEFVITNSQGEESTYTYYISDENGYLAGYNLVGANNSSIKTYIKTVRNVSIIYTNKDEKVINDVEEIILSLPEKLLVNLDEIVLLPGKHNSGAAGITDYDKVSLYNLSTYSKATIKNIVIHEIAHTWAFDLMKNKVIDFSYTDYSEKVKLDKKFPSQYAKANVQEGHFNEDFAESVSFYLINSESFTRKYPARAEYIKVLLED